VRRLIPLLLLALLGVGTALGATLGTVNGAAQTSSPSQWVAHVLAATADAGTARIAYNQITTSSNRDLRAQLHGSGQIDFTSGDVRTSEVQHSVQFSSDSPDGPLQATPTTNRTDQIGIGKTEYQDLSADFRGQQWVTSGLPRNPKTDLGLTYSNAGSALDNLAGFAQIAAVTNEGPARIDGAPTTRYLVTTAPFCPAPKSSHQSLTFQQHPTTLWIDGKDRIVQVRSLFTIDTRKLPTVLRNQIGLDTRMLGRATTTETLQFSAFGKPVHIAAPATVDVHTSTGGATISAKCATKANPSSH
jgi:hypothetical protein